MKLETRAQVCNLRKTALSSTGAFCLSNASKKNEHSELWAQQGTLRETALSQPRGSLYCMPRMLIWKQSYNLKTAVSETIPDYGREGLSTASHECEYGSRVMGSKSHSLKELLVAVKGLFPIVCHEYRYESRIIGSKLQSLKEFVITIGRLLTIACYEYWYGSRVIAQNGIKTTVSGIMQCLYREFYDHWTPRIRTSKQSDGSKLDQNSSLWNNALSLSRGIGRPSNMNTGMKAEWQAQNGIKDTISGIMRRLYREAYDDGMPQIRSWSQKDGSEAHQNCSLWDNALSLSPVIWRSNATNEKMLSERRDSYAVSTQKARPILTP